MNPIAKVTRNKWLIRSANALVFKESRTILSSVRDHGSNDSSLGMEEARRDPAGRPIINPDRQHRGLEAYNYSSRMDCRCKQSLPNPDEETARCVGFGDLFRFCSNGGRDMGGYESGYSSLSMLLRLTSRNDMRKACCFANNSSLGEAANWGFQVIARAFLTLHSCNMTHHFSIQLIGTMNGCMHYLM